MNLKSYTAPPSSDICCIIRVRNLYIRIREKFLILYFHSAWSGQGKVCEKNNSKSTDLQDPISEYVCAICIFIGLSVVIFHFQASSWSTTPSTCVLCICAARRSPPWIRERPGSGRGWSSAEGPGYHLCRRCL